MKVTTQQKLLLGVLAAGIAFLGYDQLSAIASPVPDESADSVVVNPKTRQAVIATPAMSVSVASRLGQLRTESGSKRDAFAAFAGVAAPVTEVPVHDFEKKYQLTAVIVSGSQAAAVINGSMVRLGQSIDGFTLLSVDRNSAILQQGQSKVRLQID